MVGHPSRVPMSSLGDLRGNPRIVLRILLRALSSISISVIESDHSSAPYSILREMLVYSHKAVIGWRHPNLVPVRLGAKNDD